MKQPYILAKHNEYIESDRWKCNESPTKAHHWIISGKGIVCKYCSETKEPVRYYTDTTYPRKKQE